MANPDTQPWYSGITRYQWLVLVIAAAGWAFDQYEAQVFVITKDPMLNELAGATGAELNRWSDHLFAVFLMGSALGGLLAGSLADRFGRRPLMIATILIYSLFSGLTYFANTMWQLAAIRFFVAAGVGGEWAVAASLVAEVFPTRARTYAGGIFHASQILGFWSAALVGMATGDQWRYAYLVGALPALLTFFVLARIKEPEQWQAEASRLEASATDRARLGSFRDLLFTPKWSYRAIIGCLFASTSLATFWAVMVAGQDLARDLLTHIGATDIATHAKFAYGFVQMTGAGIGLLAFGPISARLGRRMSFVVFQILAFAIVPITCFVPQTYAQLLLLMPIFGFFAQGYHSGFAVYLPELFPTHLRATGTSFCFNGGRIVAIPALLVSAWLKGPDGIGLHWALTVLATLFLLGAALVLMLPETNRQELPE
jgi:MFS family permease